jgi:hypothetical protein
MISYDFNNIHEDDFERLVVDLCNSLLGIGVHSFTKGPDGGKDGFFEGTAQAYPSTISPWSGNFIIQAKHTTIVDASCADNTFFSNQSSIINHEIERLVQMRTNKGQVFDCYILFTNRKLPGMTHTALCQHLQNGLGIQNVDVRGLEDLIRYVEQCPELIKKYQLTRYVLPDQFYESDIRDVIILFSNNTSWIDTEPLKDTTPFEFADKVRKNALNNIDDAYFNDIKSHSLQFFRSIECFLQDPKNSHYLIKYKNTTSDLRGYIQKHSDRYSFKEMLETIIDTITGADTSADIFRIRALVRVFVHFMYWNCDIGRKE